ncbi:MAG TPA: D-Ala-D-Ala carboxypeptidase family metallohydrolase [Allosphingosinicella sp.]|jgi:hypothetical protein
MLKRIGLAALPALALLTLGFANVDASHAPAQAALTPAVPVAPFDLSAPIQAPVQQAPVQAAPAPAAPAAAPVHAHQHNDGPSSAPGQDLADYRAWLARSAANREAVRAFRTYLDAEGLGDVIPVWQLIRTSSSWRECGADRFEVAPRDKWENITTTLKFVRDEVEPAVGKVEALSVYRNETLNRCSNGAPASAHRLFFALDLKPVSDSVSRPGMISRVCAAHRRSGSAYDAGLGFYSGRRFHVDSHGFRKWGPDGRGASSPCATGHYA